MSLLCPFFLINTWYNVMSSSIAEASDSMLDVEIPSVPVPDAGH